VPVDAGATDAGLDGDPLVGDGLDAARLHERAHRVDDRLAGPRDAGIDGVGWRRTDRC
jgi:hypothetical protein